MKEDMKTISVAINANLHTTISLFNKFSDRTVNMTRVCERALAQEREKINAEMTAMIKGFVEAKGSPMEVSMSRHGFNRLCKYIVDQLHGYPMAVCDGARVFAAMIFINTNPQASDEEIAYRGNNMLMESKPDQWCEELIDCLNLYPIDNCFFEKNNICLFIHDFECVRVSPYHGECFDTDDYPPNEVIYIEKYNENIEKIRKLKEKIRSENLITD